MVLFSPSELSSGAPTAPLLRVSALSKAFGGVQALSGVDVAFYPGEIHVLAGENGSGKSTLLRILSGALEPDSGSLYLDEHQIEFRDVRAAMAVGVTRISQELSLASELSVAENIFMGHGRGPMVRIDRRGWEARSREILDTLGAQINPKATVGSLRPDERQLVEIARALSFSSRLVCLDEPTSSLDPHESEFLFTVMRNLADSGVAVLFISHRLPEMLLVGDRFTVLRDGKLVGVGDRSEVDHDWLITRMVGRDVTFRRASGSTNNRLLGQHPAPLLQIKGLSDQQGKIRSATFDVRPGEVVGLAGLVGSGKTELLELIAGVRTRESGTVLVEGVKVKPGIQGGIQAGIGFLPEDRKSLGIIPEMGTGNNIVLSMRSTPVPVQRRAERKAIQHWFTSLQIKGDPPRPINTLSGGNQQKAVLARVLNRNPMVLLLDEPTRGVDVGAKAEIYEIIAELASQRIAIILASSELPEILAVSTRVLVMHSGMVAADLPFQGLTEEKIIALATGMM